MYSICLARSGVTRITSYNVCYTKLLRFKRGRFFEAKYIIERAIDNGGTTSDVIVEHYGDILYKNGDLA